MGIRRTSLLISVSHPSTRYHVPIGGGVSMFQRTLGDGVVLKLLEERDAPAVFAVVDRERAYLRQWLPWVDHTLEVGDSLSFIQTSLQQFADSDGLTLGIWCGSAFAGTIGTHKIDWLNRKVELGYWLAPQFQHRGIVTSACRTLIEHAFEEWMLNRVVIHCATGNQKSSAVPRRLGFHFEGVLRQAQLVDGAYLDLNVYSMLASEWKKKG
jgi:ribosomal-protein-serine acetyltransferase